MRETRLSGSEGGAAQPNALLLPLSLGIRFVDLLDQAGPASRRFLRNGCRPWGGAALFGGYGQLGFRLLGWTDAEGWLGWMVALPALGGTTLSAR